MVFCFSPSSWLPRVRKRWSLCMWSLVTSKHWNMLFGRTTSPKRVWQCCRPSCPGKGVTEWANQQAHCRYIIQHLPSSLLDLSTYYTTILLHSVLTVLDTHWWFYYYCCVKWAIKGFLLCHSLNVLAAVACTVVFFPFHFDNSYSSRHKNGQRIWFIISSYYNWQSQSLNRDESWLLFLVPLLVPGSNFSLLFAL